MADERLGPSAESELPEGSVTILFTNLVDATKLYERHGDDGDAFSFGVRRLPSSDAHASSSARPGRPAHHRVRQP
jgi:class 3 adenylate cyclase